MRPEHTILYHIMSETEVTFVEEALVEAAPNTHSTGEHSKCQGPSTGSSEVWCFHEHRDTIVPCCREFPTHSHTAQPETMLEATKGRWMRASHCITAAETVLNAFCMSGVRQQLRCTLPGYLSGYRPSFCGQFLCPWPWWPILTLWTRTTQNLPWTSVTKLIRDEE